MSNQSKEQLTRIGDVLIDLSQVIAVAPIPISPGGSIPEGVRVVTRGGVLDVLDEHSRAALWQHFYPHDTNGEASSA